MKKVIGSVAELFVCPNNKGYDAGDVASDAAQELLLERDGVLGDRHFGRMLLAGGRQKAYALPMTELTNIRQVSLMGESELEAIADGLRVPSISGADVGANIVISGIANLTSFPAGIHGVIRFSSGAMLYCMGENEPCDGLGKTIAARYNRPDVANKFSKVAMHRRGIVALVACPGRINLGDVVEFYYPAWHEWESNATQFPWHITFSEEKSFTISKQGRKFLLEKIRWAASRNDTVVPFDADVHDVPDFFDSIPSDLNSLYIPAILKEALPDTWRRYNLLHGGSMSCTHVLRLVVRREKDV